MRLPYSSATLLVSLAASVSASAQSTTAFCSGNPNSSGLVSSIVASSFNGSVAANDLTLDCVDLPVGAFGIFIVDQLPVAAAPGISSDGNLCLTPSNIGFLRTPGLLTAGTTGQVRIDVDLTAIPQPGGNVAAAAGDTWSFQFWHRDISGTSSNNFSEGLSVELSPPALTFVADIYPILTTLGANTTTPTTRGNSCVSCHSNMNPNGPSAGLDFGTTAQDTISVLLNTSSCNQTLVIAGNPDGSYLLEKIDDAWDQTSNNCGGDMELPDNSGPTGGTQGSFETIRQWIEDGALFN